MEKKAELIKKAEQLAFEYEQNYGGCAQCTLAAIKDTLGKVNSEVIKSATGLAGGVGFLGSTCGALTGGVLALSLWKGREYGNLDDPEKVRLYSCILARRLGEKFIQEYGSVLCKDIQYQLLGRSYDLSDEKEMQDFIQDGGRTDKCPSVCSKSAGWVVEILAEESLE